MLSGAPGGSAHASQGAGPSTGASQKWEAGHMLNAYILDHLRKQNLTASAEAFSKEANVPVESVLIDAPGGFLFEWWSVFWDILSARTRKPATDAARAYVEQQRHLQHMRRRSAEPPLPGPGPHAHGDGRASIGGPMSVSGGVSAPSGGGGVGAPSGGGGGGGAPPSMNVNASGGVASGGPQSQLNARKPNLRINTTAAPVPASAPSGAVGVGGTYPPQPVHMHPNHPMQQNQGAVSGQAPGHTGWPTAAPMPQSPRYFLAPVSPHAPPPAPFIPGASPHSAAQAAYAAPGQFGDYGYARPGEPHGGANTRPAKRVEAPNNRKRGRSVSETNVAAPNAGAVKRSRGDGVAGDVGELDAIGFDAAAGGFAGDGSLGLSLGLGDADLDPSAMFAVSTGDGGLFESASEGPAASSDRAPLELVHELSDHTDKVLACSLNVDGSVLATAGRECELYLWDTASGKSKKMGGHSEAIYDVRFCHNRNVLLATCSADLTARVWDLGVSQTVAMLRAHSPTSPFTSIDFHPQQHSLLASTHSDGVVRLWSCAALDRGSSTAAGSAGVSEGACVSELGAGMKQARFSPRSEGVVLVAGFDQKVNLFDVSPAGLQYVHTLSKHEKSVQFVQWDKEGKLVLSVSEDSVHVWDPRQLQPVRSLARPPLKFYSGIFHPAQGTRALLGTYQHVLLWDWPHDAPASAAARLPSVAAHDGIVAAMASATRQPELVATVSHDTKVKLWRTVDVN